jgi:hypothetical protein
MTRPHFTVRTKSGISYDANTISYGVLNQKYVITFLSSGFVITIFAEDVREIGFDYNPSNAGWDYCGQCDQSIGNVRLCAETETNGEPIP